ncbi:MAG: DinB family protein [Anaerolineae bacterium]|nr:DinB family protein [Anaerolineae bacterium]
MTDTAYSLLTCYQGWAIYQRMLTGVVAPLSTDQLDLAALPGKWSVGQTIQHIVANRVWWFRLWLGQGEPALTSYLPWDPSGAADPPQIGVAELVEGLAATWAMVERALAGWTPADLAETIPVPDTLSPEEQEIFRASSRGWIIWHVLEHEIHHGGEISLVLGVNGLPGIYGEA